MMSPLAHRTRKFDHVSDLICYNAELVNSRRMDEYRLFGGFVTVVKHDDDEVLVR